MVCFHFDRPYAYDIWKENEMIRFLKISNDLVSFWIDSETDLTRGEFPQNSYIRYPQGIPKNCLQKVTKKKKTLICSVLGGSLTWASRLSSNFLLCVSDVLFLLMVVS